MRDFICDICEQNVREFDLTLLVDSYRTDEVKEVCPTCLKRLEKYSYKITLVFARYKEKKSRQ
jgi:hypothetical protein